MKKIMLMATMVALCCVVGFDKITDIDGNPPAMMVRKLNTNFYNLYAVQLAVESTETRLEKINDYLERKIILNDLYLTNLVSIQQVIIARSDQIDSISTNVDNFEFVFIDDLDEYARSDELDDVVTMVTATSVQAANLPQGTALLSSETNMLTKAYVDMRMMFIIPTGDISMGAFTNRNSISE